MRGLQAQPYARSCLTCIRQTSTDTRSTAPYWRMARSAPRLGGYCLADLHEMAVGIPQEAADFAAPIMRRGEEGRAPGRQRGIGCPAVSDPQGHGVTDLIRVR